MLCWPRKHCCTFSFSRLLGRVAGVNLRNQEGVAGFTIAKEFGCIIAIRGTKAFQQHDLNKFSSLIYEISKCSKNICQLVVFTKGAQNDLLKHYCTFSFTSVSKARKQNTLQTESTSELSLQGQLHFKRFPGVPDHICSPPKPYLLDKQYYWFSSLSGT